MSALDNTDGMFTNDDLLQIQRAVQAVLYVLLPPQRGGTYVNMRFIDSRFDETIEELTSTKSPNYVLLTAKQVQIVVNGQFSPRGNCGNCGRGTPFVRRLELGAQCANLCAELCDLRHTIRAITLADERRTTATQQPTQQPRHHAARIAR